MSEMVSKKGKKVFTIKSGGQHRLTIVPYSCNQSRVGGMYCITRYGTSMNYVE